MALSAVPTKSKISFQEVNIYGRRLWSTILINLWLWLTKVIFRFLRIYLESYKLDDYFATAIEE